VNWSHYKALCDQPDYWSRWMLEQCVDLLGQLCECALQDVLLRALDAQPLEMPVDHTGPASTQMFRLTCPATLRDEFLRAISQASERGLATTDTRERGLGGFVEAWREYADYGD